MRGTTGVLVLCQGDLRSVPFPASVILFARSTTFVVFLHHHVGNPHPFDDAIVFHI